jgi:hypothetical protein
MLFSPKRNAKYFRNKHFNRERIVLPPMPGLLASVRTRRYGSALDHAWTHYRRFMHAEAAQLYRCEGAVENSIYPNGGIGRNNPWRHFTLAGLCCANQARPA